MESISLFKLKLRDIFCVTKYNMLYNTSLIDIAQYFCVLVRVEIIHKSKFLPGTVEKNSSTIRSSGRNRTYACAMPVHCSDHYATEVADRSKRN